MSPRHSIRLRRVYDEPAADEGTRILVERLWPRGLKKEDVAADLWLKDIAPSAELRKWYAHDVSKWKEFSRRYRAELEADRKSTRLNSSHVKISYAVLCLN